MIDHYGYQLSNIKYLLNRNKDKEVHCRINSPGGSVNAAIAISKAFAEHG
ncbi:MAG: ATP-dependent Clp protease proteolytic subunit, partial [Phocaeicola sp.]